VVDHRLALRALHGLNLRVAIDRIVVVVRGRDLLEDAAGLGPEAVPDTGQHQQGITGLEQTVPPVELAVEFAPQDMKGLFLAFVEMRGMPLPRQLDQHLLAVFAVDAVDNDNPGIAEGGRSVMVGIFDLELAAQLDARLVEQTLHLMHGALEHMHGRACGNLDGIKGKRGIGLDRFGRDDAVAPLPAFQAAFGIGEGKVDVIARNGVARLEVLAGKNPAAEPGNGDGFILAGRLAFVETQQGLGLSMP